MSCLCCFSLTVNQLVEACIYNGHIIEVGVKVVALPDSVHCQNVTV